MSKCDITKDSILSVRLKTVRVYKDYLTKLRLGETNPLSLKLKINEILKEISTNYKLENLDILISDIIDTATRYRVIGIDLDFFNDNTIRSKIVAFEKGVVLNDNLEASSDLITDKQQIRTRRDANREFLYDAYGTARLALLYALNQFNKNLFDCLFINRGSIPGLKAGSVRTTAELNENIRLFQLKLLNNITDYILYKAKQVKARIPQEDRNLLENPILYNELNNNTNIIESIRSYIDGYLGNLSYSQISKLYEDSNNHSLSLGERTEAKLMLEAYNSKVLLDNFDNYLTVLFGKSILLKDFGLKTSEDKYQISDKTAKLLTTWRTSENINPENEIGDIVKLMINTTPIYKWNTDTPYYGQYLTFANYQSMVGKVKDLTFNPIAQLIIFNEDNPVFDKLSESALRYLKGKSLAAAIAMIKDNSRRNTHVIFELLANEDFHKQYPKLYAKFNNDELRKLYSIYKGLYSNLNSIRALSDVNGIDYYSFLTLTTMSIFNVDFLLVYKDNNGILQLRTLLDQSIGNVRRVIELTINNNGRRGAIRNWEEYKSELLLKAIKNGSGEEIGILFVIPNTNYKVSVMNNSGRVTVDFPNINFFEIYKLVTPFLDNILRLNLKRDNMLYEGLMEEFGDIVTLTETLTQMASRVVLGQYVSNEILSEVSRDNIETTLSDYGSSYTYNNAEDELELVSKKDIPILRRLAKAKANSLGITTSAFVQDGEGNNQSCLTLSRLLGGVNSLKYLQELLPDSATRDFLILNYPGLIERIFTAKDFKEENGDVKSFTKMNVGEMVFSQIVLNYIGGLSAKDENSVHGNGHVTFLPSVNSDKSTIGLLLTNLNIEIPDSTGKLTPLKNFSTSELETIISKELGTFYQRMYETIQGDWDKLYYFMRNTIPNVPRINYLNFDLFNNWALQNPQITEDGQVLKTPIEIIKHYTLAYNRTHRLDPLTLIDLVHYIKNGDLLKHNDVIISQIARFTPLYFGDGLSSNYLSSNDFWNLKRAELLKSLLKNKVKVNTSNTNQLEMLYIRDNFKDWVNQSGDLIFAKAVIDGKVVNISSQSDLTKYGNIDLSSIELLLNPIFDKFNYLDYLITQEFMNSTVGSLVAHPEKSKSNDPIILEAARFLALHKRNVSMTAAMHAFLLNLLNGIGLHYNIAVIEDIEDVKGTVIGLNGSIKPFDGGTFVNPFVVELENNSLGEQRAGVTKKQFIHFKDHRTGTGGIIKTAGFGMTNDWIRNSLFFQRLMKKMTDHVWLNEDGSPAIVDITKDFRGNLLLYLNTYFKLGNKFFKIVGIESLGNNTYNRTIQEVNKFGDEIAEPILENKTINTNYQLWNLFGGDHSMLLVNNLLKYTNVSVENVVIAMNNTGGIDINGDIITRNNIPVSEVETQEDIWQPLKNVDVHYVVTAGAIKQGAANINSKERYNDNIPLDTFRIKMYQAGILLDKEHHADDSEVSLMTLVISACAAKGYTFDAAVKIYDALKQLSITNTLDHLKVVLELFKTDSLEARDNFREVVIKSIVDSLGNTSKANRSFAEIFCADLIKQAKEGVNIKFSDLLLPLSDNTVYSKVFSAVSSFLTRSGIKYKIPGILSVLTPSFEIFKLYNGRKYESYENPEVELLLLQDWQAPIFDANYNYTSGQERFAGKQIIEVPYNSLTSELGPVAMRNTHDGNIYIDPLLLLEKYNEKAWKTPRNSEPLDHEFKSYEEFVLFGLLHELMHDIYKQNEGESRRDYETRINNEALKRLTNTIHDLELGRKYFITREIVATNEFGESYISHITESESIDTPAQYRLLKEDIKNGVVIRVVENVKDGRNLGAYNVRFNTAQGEVFQLWDIDSVDILFLLNELNKNLNIDKLKLLYERMGGNPDRITPENIVDLFRYIKKLARRRLQLDLLNLSPNAPDVEALFQTLLSQYEDSRQYYDKFAQHYNIRFGTGDGKYIRRNGELILVDSTNYQEMLDFVQKRLENSTKVIIDGEFKTIDRASLKEIPYEIILPKVFMTAFGLDENSDLNEILNDKDYFIKLYLQNLLTLVAPNLYSIEFKRSNGDHTYVLHKDLLQNSRLTKLDNIITYFEDGATYRLDAMGNIMYEIDPDAEIYTDGLGHEVIVTNNLTFYANTLSYDTIKISDDHFAKNLLNANALLESTNKKAKKYGEHLTSRGVSNILRINRAFHEMTIDNYKTFPETHEIIQQGKSKHASFTRSLDVIAARIPAQSMQSYMAMKTVAFDNPDINSAHVSVLQILLQGSDYDIDAVTIATFDIDENGLLQLWSPYANTTSDELLNASEQLPLPTGLECEIKLIQDVNLAAELFNKYSDLFTISLAFHYNEETDELVPNENDFYLEVNTNTVEDLLQLKLFLEEVETIYKPETEYNDKFMLLLPLNYRTIIKTKEHLDKLFTKILGIVNNHNLYLNTLSKSKLSRVINNSEMKFMLDTAKDPVNQLQAQAPIDDSTEPLKEIGNLSKSAEDSKYRTPGSFINKMESIFENQVGKDGISICATGLKGFFGWTHYCNYVLNNGNADQQKRIILDHDGIEIGGNVYKTLANIRSKDPNSITNADVLEALANVTNDNDTALVLSALLSLSTDNAKELLLAKLNATTKTLGMYVYAISIGVDFREVARLLMSETGQVLSSILDGNIFTGVLGYSSAARGLEYFNSLPNKFLEKFDIKRDINGTTINKSPLEIFKEAFDKALLWATNEDGEKLSFGQAVAELARDNNFSLLDKLSFIDDLRLDSRKITSTYGKEVYNQLCDFILEYISQISVCDPEILKDLLTLADGAEEMRILGRILSLNLGILTKPQELMKQVNLIEKLIYDKTGDPADLIDIHKFVNDELYRNALILKYEEYKHTVNILDVVSTLPHTMLYITLLAANVRELELSFKFRSVRELSLPILSEFNIRDEQNVVSGIQNYVGDFLRKEWMIQEGIEVVIPAGNIAFSKFGGEYTLNQDTVIRLGTDWGDATFRRFVETQIIPDLKRDILKRGTTMNGLISENMFILDLTFDSLTHTISKNPTIVYTLPINMLPRDNASLALLESYKSEFNKLARYNYEYTHTTYDENGNLKIENVRIPLTDIFTYYAMIAHDWKLRLNSLVPILDDFLNTGIIKRFHDFEALIDKSGKTLRDFGIYVDDLIYYVAPRKSPYSAYENYIYSKNHNTNKIELMRKMSKLDYMFQGDDDYGYSSNQIGNYTFVGSEADTKYFTKGTIYDNSSDAISYEYMDGDTSNKVVVSYDRDSDKITSIILNGEQLSLNTIDKMPFKKVDGLKLPNIDSLTDLIKHQLNPC